MNPEEILKQLVNDEVFLLDVREKYEWSTGHIARAINIPLDTIDVDTVKELPKDKPILVYCRSGSRAETAKRMLNDLGFDNVVNIGGIVDWQVQGGKLVM